MLPCSTHLTPVIGLDIHFSTSGNPFHPYIGMVIDPFDYIPFLGSSVNVNGLKRGVSDTGGMLITFKHIPLFGGFDFKHGTDITSKFWKNSINGNFKVHP